MKPKKSLKFISLLLLSCLGLSILNFAYPSPAIAANNICNDENVAEEVKNAAGCNKNSNQAVTIVTRIIRAVIAVLGLVAVIFIISGGIQYMSSTGDPQKVQKAKNTILYAVIGLVVCALAFTIVNFVIYRIQ